MNCTVHPARPFLLLLVLAAVLPVQSQKTEGNSSPRLFDVASIKRSKPGAVIQDMRITFPPGRMEAVDITLSEMLLSFSGFSGKVEGGPKWVESERYDVIAKADGEITPAERGPMLMALLQDRFKLTVHHEAKEEPGIALTKGKQLPDVKPAKGWSTDARPFRRPPSSHLQERQDVPVRGLSSWNVGHACGRPHRHGRQLRFFSRSR